jgi:PRC-barrel domain
MNFRGGDMRKACRAAVAAMLIFASAAYSAGQGIPLQQKSGALQEDSVPGANGTPREPTVTVLDHQEVQGILGREVRSGADEKMGRIVDVIVDRNGQVRAAIIDFGGFLGVGSRKIAVAWNALRFLSDAKNVERIGLELTRDQVQGAPEYKEDKPVVVLGASGGLESLPFP